MLKGTGKLLTDRSSSVGGQAVNNIISSSRTVLEGTAERLLTTGSTVGQGGR